MYAVSERLDRPFVGGCAFGRTLTRYGSMSLQSVAPSRSRSSMLDRRL